MKPRRLRIFVTDAHELVGLGAIRSLGRAGHFVTAGFPRTRKNPPSGYSRYCDEIQRYPNPWKEHFEFREYLRRIMQSGDYDALLPNSEAAILAASSLREFLPSDFLMLIPDDTSLAYTLSKYNATKAAMDAGVPTPKTFFLVNGSSENPSSRELAELDMPLILKTDNMLLSNGEYLKGKTHIVFSMKAAEAIIEQAFVHHTHILAQEYIHGSGTGAFIMRWGGGVHLAFAHLRIHEVPFWGGVSSLRKSIKDDHLTDCAEKILNKIAYSGVAMVEFRRSSINHLSYFLEINGRLWGSLALALHCGVDFPAALVDCHSAGRPDAARQKKDYKCGVYCSNVYPGEVSYLASVWKKREPNFSLKRPSPLKAFLEVFLFLLYPGVKHDYFWWSDPFPGYIQGLHFISWLGKRLFPGNNTK